MSREVSYARQTLDAANPLARYCHRKRHKIGLELVANLSGREDAILDFGCGQGSFLNALKALRPDLHLFGFDPESNHVALSYRHVSSMQDICSRSVAIVTAFETLEHLYPDEREGFYRDAARVLIPGGWVIASVPIIAGPALLVKELNRFLMFRRPTDYSVKELLAASLLGLPAQAGNVRTSHKGFDYRVARSQLRSSFQEEREFFSPMRGLPAVFNSQMFWLGRRGD